MRELLPFLPRPSLYTGAEQGAAIKDRRGLKLHIALAFPDTYEVGMSYLGQKILYDIANSRPDWLAERVFLPESGAAEILRKTGTALATLESDTALKELDAVCFSVTHELCYTDILHMLDLAGIPFRAEERLRDRQKWPLIMAGGGAMLGAEAIAPFFDLIALGEGEELNTEIFECFLKEREKGSTREEFLEEAAKIAGVYVPSFFRESENGSLEPVKKNYRPARRIVPDLEDASYPLSQVMPFSAVHNRLALEIARGCTRGCRFCHAGSIYRPVRERSPEKVKALLEECLEKTGFEEVSFLSLSAGDYSQLERLFDDSFEHCAKEQISLALPSLRVGSVDQSVMAKMARLRRTGVTLAPEAGSQRLRDVINKGISEEELLDHIRMLLELGWRNVKLYFMIGLPTETDEDLQAIIDLCDKVRDVRISAKTRMNVTAALSTFVPKPFTPFQWESQPDLPEIGRKIQYVLDYGKNRKYLKIRWHNPEASHLEGILSRAGRDMAKVVERAYEKGALYCSWADKFSLSPWLSALEECGQNPARLHGGRNPEEALPWDHIECGISRDFLLRERDKAYNGVKTADCRYGSCQVCGVCDIGKHKSLLQKPASHNLPYRHRLAANGTSARTNDAGEKRISCAQGAPRIREELKQRFKCFRIWHNKLNNLAYLSQLELQDQLERALRRAHIPLAFSGGFHPMPLVSFTRALSVGISSNAEWFSMVLHKEMDSSEIQQRLQKRLPQDLDLFLVEEEEIGKRKPQSDFEQFLIAFRDKEKWEKAVNSLERIFANEVWQYSWQNKKGEKTLDLRPFLKRWKKKDDFTLALETDWTNSYISPLILVKGIFGERFSGDSVFSFCAINKSSQILNNRLYGQDIFS